MKNEHYIGGNVDKTFSYGKTGIIRGLDGNQYYYNPSSIESEHKKLKVGDSVVFCVNELVPKTGKFPRAIKLKTVNEVMKTIEESYRF